MSTATIVLAVVISCVLILIFRGRKQRRRFETQTAPAKLAILRATSPASANDLKSTVSAIEVMMDTFKAGVVGVKQLPPDPLTGRRQPLRYDVLIAVEPEGTLIDVVRKFKLLGYGDDRDWSVARTKSNLTYLALDLPQQWNGNVIDWRLIYKASITDDSHYVGYFLHPDSSISSEGEWISLSSLQSTIVTFTELCRKLNITNVLQIQTIWDFIQSNPYSAQLFSITNEGDMIGIYFAATTMQGLRTFLQKNKFDSSIIAVARPDVIIQVAQRFKRTDTQMKSLLASFYMMI